MLSGKRNLSPTVAYKIAQELNSDLEEIFFNKLCCKR
ncbi:hypothetical protein [Alkalihalobacillus alcalophilus]